MNTVEGTRGERGAITIHVAIALIGLLAFSSFVVDAGLMWVSRGQAQNAADAGALAGGIALVRDGGGPLAPAAVVTAAAESFAASNAIWGDSNVKSGPNRNIEVTVSGGLQEIDPCGPEPGCVRVDVMRNSPSHTNPTTPVGAPLPTFFAKIVGIGEQGVRATATAQIFPANATKCLRPFALPDPPGLSGPGSGYTLANVGDELTVTYSNVGAALGSYRYLKLVDSTGLREQTQACIDDVYGIGDTALIDPTVDSPPAKVQIKAGVDSLIGFDPGAGWNGTAIVGSCIDSHTCSKWDGTGNAQNDDLYAAVSPRVIAVPVFDPASLNVATGELRIVNIVGLFIKSVDNSATIVGVLIPMPGLFVSEKGRIPKESAFIRAARLVR